MNEWNINFQLLSRLNKVVCLVSVMIINLPKHVAFTMGYHNKGSRPVDALTQHVSKNSYKKENCQI